MVVHMAHTLIGTDVVVVELCDIVVDKVVALVDFCACDVVVDKVVAPVDFCACDVVVDNVVAPVDFCACDVVGPFDVGFVGEVSLVPLI